MKQAKVTIYANPEAQNNGLMPQIKADVVRYTMEHLFESRNGEPLLFPERTTSIAKDTPNGTLRVDFLDVNGHGQIKPLEILVRGFSADRVAILKDVLEDFKKTYPKDIRSDIGIRYEKGF